IDKNVVKKCLSCVRALFSSSVISGSTPCCL
ncbi:hypothetical protein TNCT_717641, partial [Trichonephila clavata]